jgi:hypothetical protein
MTVNSESFKGTTTLSSLENSACSSKRSAAQVETGIIKHAKCILLIEREALSTLVENQASNCWEEE